MPDGDEGLKLQHEGDFETALTRFDAELNTERRDWAWRELQAAAAGVCVRLGRRTQAVDRIEQILEQDQRSRHISLLPLVWDARMPAAERIRADPADLTSPTSVRRLVAASALLHEVGHRAAASSVLHRILQTEGLSRLGELARTQLWRLHLLEKSDDRNPVLQVWADRVREMPVDARAGPQYIVAREFQQRHDYDRAAPWVSVAAAHVADRRAAGGSVAQRSNSLPAARRPPACGAGNEP